MKRYLSLDEFMQRQHPMPADVRHKQIVCWTRKNPRMVDDRYLKAITIANVTNLSRRDNIEFDPDYKPTGQFREFERMCREAALEYGYDGVFVENVHTEFLRDVLIRYGYRRVNMHSELEYNYWISVNDR